MRYTKCKKRESNGITLIALVVTIIVLLILAGITVGTLTGDNGVVDEAKLAKEQAERTALEEQIEAAIVVVEQKYKEPTLDQIITEIKKIDTVETVDKKTGMITSTLGYTIEGKLDDYLQKQEEQAKPGEEVTGSNKEYTSGEYTAIIPVEFTIVPGCEDISQGLVISDNPNDTELDPNNIVANGNQFVWIPVTEDSYVRNKEYDLTNVSAKAYTDNNYLPDEIQAKIQVNINAAEATDTKTKEEVIRRNQ